MNVNSLRSFLWFCGFVGILVSCLTTMSVAWWVGHFAGYGYQCSVIAFTLYAWQCFSQADVLFAVIQQTIEQSVAEYQQDQL